MRRGIVSAGFKGSFPRYPLMPGFRPIASGCHSTNLPWKTGNHSGSSLKKGKIGRGGSSRFRMVFPMFHIDPTTGHETLNGTAATFRCAFSPNGTDWFDFRQNGNTNITGLASDRFVVSDPIDTPFVPADTMASWMTDFDWENGLGSAFNALSNGRGEWVTNGGKFHVADRSAPVSPTAGAGYAPILIGETREHGVVHFGDSRFEGQAASQFGDAFGDRSWVERWVSQKLRLGYINMGLNGDSAQKFSGNSDMRMALAQACGASIAVFGHGVNDLLAVSGVIAAQTLRSMRLNFAKAKRNGILKVFANKPAGRTARIDKSQPWVPGNQKPYNSNFGPEPSQWTALLNLMDSLKSADDLVDLVLDAELTYCNGSPPNNEFLANRVADGVHQLELAHTAIAMLAPSYEECIF